ncbi:SDR family oxidoreductase, partial [Pseudomonadales bacterium]|nr:SDR family oxidoreductase [Pseudomonadales bacterium]
SDRLKNKRVLITQCGDYMGPAIAQLFAHEGALIDARPGSVPAADAFAGYVSQNADIDILVANLAHAPCNSPTADIQDADWEGMFDTMVHPLMRLIRHFAPLMAERGHGKIVAITSAAPLRGLPGSAAYCAARGAQNAFIRATGLEFAATNVQINAIAQNYVSNPEYYPDELVASERFQNHLKRNVPIRRIAKAEESAELALFLASNNSDFMVGQVVPFAGGWATNT